MKKTRWKFWWARPDSLENYSESILCVRNPSRFS